LVRRILYAMVYYDWNINWYIILINDIISNNIIYIYKYTGLMTMTLLMTLFSFKYLKDEIKIPKHLTKKIDILEE
jgi:hypothetical protein